MDIHQINRLRELSGMPLMEEENYLPAETTELDEPTEPIMSQDPNVLLDGPNYDIVRNALEKAEFTGYKTGEKDGVIEIIISPQDYPVDKKEEIIEDLDGIYNPISSDFFKAKGTQEDIAHVVDNKDIKMKNHIVEEDQNHNIIVKINYEV